MGDQSWVDERVVEIKFNNADFERRCKDTTTSLEELKKSLNLDASAQSLSNLQNTSDKFNLDNMTNSLNEASNGFKALDAVAFTVLFNITNMALTYGKKIGAAILTPLIEGGKKRALNIQQAKFQFEGLGMDVEETMANALEAVLGTAYSLDQAAIVASMLGATGMKSGDEMTRSLRAVAGVAAMTGREYSDVGNIFTTVAGNGRLMGMQLLQLGTQGINAAAVLGKYLGKTEVQVRDMVTKGQISFATFRDAMYDAFGAHAAEANKLYSGSLANLNSAISRIGATIATAHFDNMIGVFNALRPVVDKIHEALKPFMKDWITFSQELNKEFVLKISQTDVAPLTPLLTGLKNILVTLYNILMPIKEAFKEVFPAKTTAELMLITESFAKFTEKIKIGETTIENIKTTFKGLFTILDVIVSIIAIVIKTLANVTVGLAPFISGILKVTSVISKLVSSFFNAIDIAGNFEKGLEAIGRFLSPLGLLAQGFQNISIIISKIGDFVGNTFAKMIDAVSKSVSDFNAGGAFEAIAGIGVLAILKQIEHVLESLANTVGVGGTFGIRIIRILRITKMNLVAFENEVKAKTLLTIAFAIGVLAASLYVLSGIDPGKLGTAMAGIAGLFASLMASMTVFTTLSKGMGFFKIQAIGLVLIELSVAILILSAALKNLSSLDWGEIAKGVVGIGSLVTILVIAAEKLSAIKGRLIKGASGLVLFSTSILILSVALKQIGELNISQIAKGLAGVGGLVAELVLFSKYAKAIKPSSSVSILILAGALLVLGQSVKLFSTMDLPALKQGLIALGILLTEITIFTNLTKNAGGVVATAIGLTILGGALMIFAKVITQLGELPYEVVEQGLVALSIALGIICVTLRLMQGNILGALSLIVMAGALAILAPVLKIFGSMSLKAIASSLLMLAGVFGVLGIATTLLMPLIPALLGIAAAIFIIGAGFLAGGTGMLAMGAGLTAIALAAVASGGAIVGLLRGLIDLIPILFRRIGEGILELANAIGNGGPTLIVAFRSIIGSLLTVLAESIPAFVSGTMLFMTNMLNAINERLPEWSEASWNIIFTLLKGITDNMSKLVDAGVDIITNFITGIRNNLPVLIQAGWDLIIDFINGMADSIALNMPLLVDAMFNLADAMIQGLVNGLAAGVSRVATTIKDVGQVIIDVFSTQEEIESPSKVFVRFGEYIVDGLVLGMVSGKPSVYEASKLLAQATQKGLIEAESSFTNIGDTVGTNFLKSLTDDEILNKAWEAGVLVSTSAFEGAQNSTDQMLAAGTAAGQAYIDGLNAASKEAQANVRNLVKSGELGKKNSDKIKAERAAAAAAGLEFENTTPIDMTNAERIIYEESGGGTAGFLLVEAARELARDVGDNIVYGLNEGIMHGVEEVGYVMNEVTAAAIDAAKANLEIKSPSKVFYKIGMQTVKGLANGLKNYSGLASTEAGNIALTSINALKESISHISDIISNDLDMNPTIRPVLDLSDVDRNKKKLNSIFENQSLNVRAANIKASSITGGVQKEDGINNQIIPGAAVSFVQNNYSPTPLSRLDIYRQTKNQFSLLKGVVDN